MNKKGFTLVELMAVIVIISIVALVGVTSITGVRKQMDKKLFEEKLNSAISSAEKWGEDNKEELTLNITISVKDGDETVEKTVKGAKLTIGNLIANDYYESEEAVNPNLYNYTKCSNSKTSQYGYKDGEFCKNIVTNNVDSLIVNEISIKIFTNNNRVYACIEKNTNNKNLIKETDAFDKYNKDLYC